MIPKLLSAIMGLVISGVPLLLPRTNFLRLMAALGFGGS